MLFFSWNKSKEESKRKKETKTRNQRKAKKKTRRQEERKNKRDRERESEKGGGQKRRRKTRETLKNKHKCPFLGGKTGFSYWEQRKQRKKTKTKQIGGFRAKWGGPSGHLTWPLNPSKETKNKTNPPKKQLKTKNRTKRKKPKNTKIPKIELFSYQSFLFWWVSKISLFDDLAKQACTQKHYKNRGFSKAFFEKHMCVMKRPFLDKTKPNPEIPVIISVCLFLLFQQHKA